MFSPPVRSGWMPARTSMRAPTRPATSSRPAYGYITRVRILSRVDLPEPLAPISPTDSPGRTTRSMSWSAQRHRLEECSRRSRLLSRSSSSRSSMRVRSVRNRFQRWRASMLPSGDIREPRFQALERLVSDQQVDRSRDRRDGQERRGGLLAVEDRAPVAVDHRPQRVEGDIEWLQGGWNQLVEREGDRGGEQPQLQDDGQHVTDVPQVHHDGRDHHRDAEGEGDLYGQQDRKPVGLGRGRDAEDREQRRKQEAGGQPVNGGPRPAGA